MPFKTNRGVNFFLEVKIYSEGVIVKLLQIAVRG